MNDILPGEHVSVFGISGCGKSTLTRQLSEIFHRKIIFDRLGEWDTASGPIASDFDSFARLYRETHELESFTIFIRPRAGSTQEYLSELTNEILSLVYQVEKFNRQGLAVIFEEIWLYASTYDLPPWLMEILLTGRHFKISVIGNAQRPAAVSKTFISQSRHVFIGQFFEARDRQYFRETLGDIEALAQPPEKFKFYWYRPNLPAIMVQVSP